MIDNPDISVIVPCRKADQFLREKVISFFEKMSQCTYTYELVFLCPVTDMDTKNILVQLRREYPRVKYFIYNGKATRNDLLMKGLYMAAGKYIGFMTQISRMQHYLMAALLELEKGNDMVLLKRHFSITESPFTIFYYLSGTIQRFIMKKLFGFPQLDIFTPNKVFKRECLLGFAQRIPEPVRFSDFQLMQEMIRGKNKIKEIDSLVLRKNL